jgi:branched-chain amino acid transport system substrate-binding protein
MKKVLGLSSRAQKLFFTGGVKMKQNRVLIVCCLVVLTLSLSTMPCTASGSGQSEGKPIRLGVLVDFTGPMAFAGQPVVDGIKMRLEEANYEVAGRKVELVIEDSATDASVALQKAKKMVERDKVCFIIGPMISAMRMAVIPYLARQKILTISIHNDPLESTKFGNNLVYPGPLSLSSLPVAKYASEELGYRTATCIGADYNAGHAYIDTLARQFEKMGGKAVQEQWAPLGTMDWGPYLVNMKKADCVAIWTIDSDIVPFMQQYKAFGMKMPLIMPEAHVITSAIVAEKGESLKGIIGNIHYHWGIDNPVNKKYVAAFNAKYHRMPEHHETHAYIDTSIFLAGVEKTKGDTSFKKLKKAILGLKMNTPQGPLAFDPNGVARNNVYVCDIQKIDGVWVWHTIKTFVQPPYPKN